MMEARDSLLTIAIGRSRKERFWKNEMILWSDLVERLSRTIRTDESCEDYRNWTKARRDDVKDVGGFVGGALRDGRRRADNIGWRQIVTLDADFVDGDLWASYENIIGCGGLVYSTHSHSPEKPRLRLVIPLRRGVSPDEYGALSRLIAADLGIDQFDDTTYEPHRLMYWPSTPRDGEYVFKVLDEEWLDPDVFLSRYEDWKDSSSWFESSRALVDRKRQKEKQGDPRGKKGIVGAFCRTYDIHQVIEKYLGEVYSPCNEVDRYTYIQGSSAGGLVVYSQGDLAYSHHGTDPTSGKLCNAFDLVRLHKFHDLDLHAKEGTPIVKMPSYLAMGDLALDDMEVKKQIALERMGSLKEDFQEDIQWQESLEIDKKGELRNTLTNIILILRHDPKLGGIFYNEFKENLDVVEDLPWKRFKGGWNKTDEASLAGYLDLNYNLYSPGKLREAMIKVAVERSSHPVKEYLRGLAKWDGEKRVDKLLVRYLGAEDNVYTREVTRKTLVASIGRIYSPGIKFDTTLVLVGKQGIGKSTIFAKLGGKFFSDSLSISDMKDKTAAEKLQGYWIVEMGELAGIRKVDEDTLKSFLTRGDDKFRASYGYTVEDHPRQSVIVGTTNQETGFLRDITGGRRFWPVHVDGNTKDKPWDMEDVDQIWAEAVHYYEEGESLILSREAESYASLAQIDALESDEREGVVKEYLDRLLPANWGTMDLYARRSFIRGDEFGEELVGSMKRDQVCTMEIWCELFGKEATGMKKMDSYEINAIMRKIRGWKRYEGNKEGRRKLPIYGIQRIFIRD